jgi:hypothetical protein
MRHHFSAVEFGDSVPSKSFYRNPNICSHGTVENRGQIKSQWAREGTTLRGSITMFGGVHTRGYQPPRTRVRDAQVHYFRRPAPIAIFRDAQLLRQNSPLAGASFV